MTIPNQPKSSRMPLQGDKVCRVSDMPNSFESHPHKVTYLACVPETKIVCILKPHFFEATAFVLPSLRCPLRQNIGQQYCWCSLMWLMPLRSLSNCDYELKNLPRLILGPIHSNQVMGTDPVGSYHGTRNSRSNSINPTYPYQSHN